MKITILNKQNLVKIIDVLSTIYFILAILKQINIHKVWFSDINLFYNSLIINLFFFSWMLVYLLFQTISALRFSMKNIVLVKSINSLIIYENIKYLTKIATLIIVYSIAKIVTSLSTFEIEPNLAKETSFLLLISSYATILVITCVILFLVSFLLKKYFHEVIRSQRNDVLVIFKTEISTLEDNFLIYEIVIDIIINENNLIHFIYKVNQADILIVNWKKYKILKQNKKAMVPPHLTKSFLV